MENGGQEGKFAFEGGFDDVPNWQRLAKARPK